MLIKCSSNIGRDCIPCIINERTVQVAGRVVLSALSIPGTAVVLVQVSLSEKSTN
jgi:hypothetical protein